MLSALRFSTGQLALASASDRAPRRSVPASLTAVKLTFPALFCSDPKIAQSRDGGGRCQHRFPAALGRGRNAAFCRQLSGQFLRRALGDQFALGNDQHPVADRLHFAQDMAGQDHRVGFAQIMDLRTDLDHLGRVQAHRGLIQNDDLR